MSGDEFVAVLIPGEVSGIALRLSEPLSFWGGVDPTTGLIVEERHPQHGQQVTAKILSMPHGRGSSSSSAVLAESLRLGTGPAAIILDQIDSILIVGALVARELYGSVCPMVVSNIQIHTGERWALINETLAKVPN